VAPRSEDPKLIMRVINFELVQPICSAYRNVTDGQTDRQTDGRTTYDSNTALALRALRGKNERKFQDQNFDGYPLWCLTVNGTRHMESIWI